MNIAIVTGASSGIGREFARQISEKYPKLDEIWIIARRFDRLSELSEEYTDVPSNFRKLGLDLTTESDLEILSKTLSDIKPKVHILVNSAGCGHPGSFECSRYDDVLNTIALNCNALTAVTYLVLPYISAHGRIINIASVAAFLPQPDFAVYAASKSYVMSFSRALKYELSSRKISVTAVCPGPVDTEFFDSSDAVNNTKKYKKLFITKPQKVVSKALKDAALNDELSIYGISMKLIYILSKVVPHRIILKIVYGRGR